MPYTPVKPTRVPPRSVLETKVPGWGVDLDPKDRPAYPKERLVVGRTGANWQFPERQEASYRREKSTEHAILTPVFGTSCPPRGLSGMIRRLAYDRYSEGQSAHWLLLMLADRVDVIEHLVVDVVRGRPDNFIAEMGLGTEIWAHGLRSRLGRGRADVAHMPIDALLFGGRVVLAGVAVYGLVRKIARMKTSRRRRGLARLPLVRRFV